MASHGIFGKDSPFERQVAFNDHDDRGFRGGGMKRGGRRGGRRGRGGGRGGMNSKNRLDDTDYDGDVTMGEDHRSNRGHRRFQPYGRSRTDHSPPSGSVFSRLGASAGPSSSSVFTRLSGLGGEKFTTRGASWHKITISKGANVNRDWLLKHIQSNISEPFQPVQVHVRGDKLMFFVEEGRAANQMKRLRQVEAREGTLFLRVNPCPPPRGTSDDSDTTERRFGSRLEARGGRGRGGRGGGRGGGRTFDGDIQMEEDSAAVVLQVLGQRFDTATRSLDLSDMFHDQSLQERGVKGVMYDRSFVSTILSMIGQHCPDLLALDLSNNRIQRLDSYTDLPTKCASLQILNLSDNQIRSPAELENIRNMSSLTTLVLENNPFTQHNRDFLSYSSSMRKLFPNLQLLDGQQLPSPVKFDLPVLAGQLPTVEKSYLVNDEVKNLVVTFLEQYYTMYDGDSREKLLEAYSNDALLSLSVSMPQGGSRGPSLQSYIHQSRNLGRVKDPSKRHSLLKHGRIDIVQCLRDLPKTRHHPGAFSVDVIRATPVSTAFVVYGLFSEVSGARPENCPVRAFSRTFVLTAAGNGVAITNDQMTIRNASTKNMQYAKEEMSKIVAQQPPTLQQFSASQAPPASLPGPSFQSPPPTFGNAQEEAITTLSQQTGMNLEWSRKCLAENEWDYSKAQLAFSLLSSQGKVPSEAFLQLQ